jgi:hypothetical protein
MKKKAKSVKVNIIDLCDDLMVEIFLFLYGSELYRIRQTCREFNRVIFEKDIIWKIKCDSIQKKHLIKYKLSREMICFFEDDFYMQLAACFNQPAVMMFGQRIFLK